MERLGFSNDTRQVYESFGHTISNVGTIGSAMGVYRDPDTGEVAGAADSRAADGGVATY